MRIANFMKLLTLTQCCWPTGRAKWIFVSVIGLRHYITFSLLMGVSTLWLSCLLIKLLNVASSNNFTGFPSSSKSLMVNLLCKVHLWTKYMTVLYCISHFPSFRGVSDQLYLHGETKKKGRWEVIWLFLLLLMVICWEFCTRKGVL